MFDIVYNYYRVFNVILYKKFCLFLLNGLKEMGKYFRIYLIFILMNLNGIICRIESELFG